MKYICPQCKNEFEAHKSRAQNAKHVCCSKECANAFLSSTNKGEANPNYKGGKPVKVQCECGGMKDHRAKHCRKCRDAIRNTPLTDELRDIIASSTSINEIADRSNLCRDTVRKILNRNNVDTSHLWSPTTSEAILVKRKSGKRNQMVRVAVLRDNLVPYVCACGLVDEWQGKPITLDLDHINGDTLDDRVENLRFLCPNCHSQTDTYKGRNIGR